MIYLVKLVFFSIYIVICSYIYMLAHQGVNNVILEEVQNQWVWVGVRENLQVFHRYPMISAVTIGLRGYGSYLPVESFTPSSNCLPAPSFLGKMVTLWIFNIAMENGPFIDNFPSYKPPCIMAMLNNQRVLTMWAWGKQPCQRSEATEDPILGGFHGPHDPPKNSPSCDRPNTWYFWAKFPIVHR